MKQYFSALTALGLLVAFGPATAQVKGFVDGTFPDASGGMTVRGWACQVGQVPSIGVHLYVGGPAGSGTFAVGGTANLSSESGVASACQSTGTAYRFSLPLSAAVRQSHGGKRIYVHGLSSLGTGNLVISQSGVYLVPRPVAAIRRYTYNAYQELCKVYEPETGVTVMAYDGAGNLGWSAGGLNLTSHNSCNESSVPATRKAVRSYDARNRLTNLTFADGKGNQTWTYTPDGLPASVVTQNVGDTRLVTNTYAFNHRGLLTGEGQAFTGWGTFYQTRTYNANGHLSQVTFPAGYNGPIVDYAPNALGQPTKAGSFASNVSYYPNGAVKQFTYGNGIVHTLTQNARGLPDTSCDFYGSCNASAILNDGYDYDQNGNVQAISDGRTGNRGNRSMTYDSLDRLTATTSPMFGTATYAYNVLDNLTRVKLTGGNQVRDHTYVYDANNRLTNVTNTVGGASVIGLGYDAQGNLQNKSGQIYTFDLGNRLRAVPNKEEDFYYDAHGRRVLSNRYVNGTSALRSSYSVDGQLLFQQDQGLGVRKDFIYLGNNLIAERSRPNTTEGTPVTVKYQHTDALGSPVAITNEARTVVERTEYEPYGSPANRMARNGVGYTGHVEDAATGLVYMQQRYYDPGIGRFLSVDPVTANRGTGANFNRYWYANNNPYKFTDPDGRYVCTASNRVCIRIERAAQVIHKAAAKAGPDSRLAQISEFLGEAGVVNGVSINDKVKTKGNSGEATREQNGVHIAINMAKLSTGDRVASVLVHEGSHGVDHMDPRISKQMNDDVSRSALNASELRGGESQAKLFQALGRQEPFKLYSPTNGINWDGINSQADRSVKQMCASPNKCNP